LSDLHEQLRVFEVAILPHTPVFLYWRFR
jgi:hypothetical protein